MESGTLPTFQFVGDQLEGDDNLINPNKLALIDQLVQEQGGRCAGIGVGCDNQLGEDASLDEANVRLLCAKCQSIEDGSSQPSSDRARSEERRAA
jgi:hypothetical protein